MKSGKISVQQICGALALIWLSQPSVVLAQTVKVSPQLVATGIVPAQKASPLQNQDRDIRKPFKIAQTVTDGSGATTPAKQRPEALVKKGPPNSEKKGLDPVDLASGVFIDSHTDAVVTGGRTPFGFVRSYRSLDKSLGAFGIGTSHNFDIAIQPQSATVLQLQMNDNARFNFTLNTAGTAYINQSDPTLIGSTIIKNSLGYTLRYKNGETLTFNIRGWLTATTDRNGNRIQILRDNADAMYRIRSTSGFLAFGTTPIQSGSQLVYRIDSISDQVGRFVRYTYNSNNQLIRVTRQDGLTVSYDYDATNGNMTQLTDARGIVYLKNFYDGVGRIVQQTQPEGILHKAEYTQFDPSVNLGLIAQTKVTLPNGNINTYNFNNELYPTNETDALGQVYQSNRLPGTNQVASITDPLARTAQVSYDITGNVTQLLDPQGNKTQITYEPTFNLPTKVTNDIGNASTVTRDAKGNPTRMQDPLGHGVTIQYDQYGQVISTKNDVDGPTTYAYDSLGRVTTVTMPLGKVKKYAYDGANRATSMTDEIGRITKYAYDALDRVVQTTYPDGSRSTLSYDGNSNLSAVTDENGNITRYQYDQMDRLVKRTNPLGQNETYSYDFNGNLVSKVDRKGRTYTYRYDQRDDLKEEDLPGGVVRQYTYDPVERLTQINDNVDGQIGFGYDTLDRLVSETTPQGTVNYGYDSISRRTSLQASNGYLVNYNYDAANRLAKIVKDGQNYSFSYDNVNRMTGMSMPNGVASQYGFDAASRLSQILHQKNSQTLKSLGYVFDAADQITQISGMASNSPEDSVVASASTNANNQYTMLDGQTVSHDANGNQVAQGPVSYQWDVRNRLVGITGPGTTASFTYDALGRRATKTTNGQSQAYQYDGADIIRDASAEYVQGPGIDNVLDRKDITTGNNEYYLKDHLGSTIALTDQSGNITTQYAYSPFGQVVKTGANSNNYFEYTGRENDGTGLYFYRARYYDPQQKRFIAEDPLGFGGGDTNLQAYVGGNPIKLTDPSGLLGVGFAHGGIVEGGNGAVGGASSGSVAHGLFTGKEDGPTIGNFHSEGAFAGGPYGGPSVPTNVKGNFASGAYAGYGSSVFVTNADTAEDAAGRTTRMFSRDVGIPGVASFSVQLSYGNDGIFVLNIGIPGLGEGGGNGSSHMPTQGQGFDTPIFGKDLRQGIINDLINQFNYPAGPSNLGANIGGIGKRK